MTEQEVLKLVLSGDPRAIRSLVDQYQPMVLRTARGFVRNTDDARDIAQEVFIDIITNLHRFREQAGLATWIYRITVNRSLNYLRKNKRRMQNHNHIANPAENGQDAILNLSDRHQKDPAQLLEQKEKARVLHDAIESLPDNQKIAFTLSEYEDLSYKEISEVMQVSLSSVESLLFRARKNLQKKLWHCYKK